MATFTSTSINSSRYYRKSTLIPNFLSFEEATLGTTVLVTGVAGTRILVLSFSAGSSAAQDLGILSDTNTLAVVSIPANDSISFEAPMGCFVTEDGEDLVIDLSSATAVKGSLTYVII